MIQLEGVTRKFEGRTAVTALHDTTLSIPRGQMVSIVGPSGSGKSTLLNLIGALDTPSSGDIRIDGESLAQLDDDGRTRIRRDKIGFIFQFFNLLPTLTCLENVGLPLHLRGWPRKKVVDRARELLGLVHLSDRLDHLPDQLSGGQRRRVAIARAMAAKPGIILYDEATTGLDPITAITVVLILIGIFAFGAVFLRVR